MIKEDYVSFEVSKLLKEKGFYGECFSMYVTPKPHCGMGEPNEPKIAPHGRDSHFYEGYLYQCEAPTLQMACKWLREVHNLFIFPFPQMNTNKFWTEIYQLSNNQEWENLYCESIDLQDYSTYEEAVEAALKYTLENLI